MFEGSETAGLVERKEVGDADPGPQDPVLWRQQTNTHGLPSPVEEKGQHGHSLKRGAPDTCLDRLLFLFWAHYIEDDPHLLCTGLLQAVTQNKGEGVANYIKEE